MALTFREDRIRIVSWADARPAQLEFDPRSAYVERYWLPILGPATTWLLRRLATELDSANEGWWMDCPSVARSLGLTSTSRNGPFQRALGRACTFRLAKALHPSMVAVRRTLPALTPNQVTKLPTELQVEHQRWTRGLESRHPIEPGVLGPQEAVGLALTLLRLGQPLGEVDASLARWGVEQRCRQQALFEAYDQYAA